MLLGETLPHSLPWYFGLTLFLIWVAAMVALALLIRHWVRARAEGRRAGRNRRGSGRHVRDDRALGPGKDVETW
jgi:hypothetical protein